MDEYKKMQQDTSEVMIFEQKKEHTPSKRKVVQYEIEFDLQKAKELREIKLKNPEKYEDEEKAFEGFINMQLLTALGERYNRGISEFSYRIKDGKLLGEHSDEPFETVLERGRDYRKKHGDPVDHQREAAEVIGFKKMQAIMTDEATPAGTVVISVSPPGQEGSIYKHNFYDAFKKREDGTLQTIRFSSALTPEETIERLWEIVPTATFPEEVSDIALLSHPILLGNELILEELHKKLHRDHQVMSEEDFMKVKEVYEVMMTSYIAGLKEDPENEQKQKEIYNAGLNIADDMADALKNKTSSVQNVLRKRKYISDNEFYALAYRPVRAVDTGCGLSGGADLGGGMMGGVSALGAYGVSAFGSEGAEDDPNLCKCGGAAAHFHCPGTKTEIEKDKEGKETKKKIACNYKITVGKGITMCPDCGESKKC